MLRARRQSTRPGSSSQAIQSKVRPGWPSPLPSRNNRQPGMWCFKDWSGLEPRFKRDTPTSSNCAETRVVASVNPVDWRVATDAADPAAGVVLEAGYRIHEAAIECAVLTRPMPYRLPLQLALFSSPRCGVPRDSSGVPPYNGHCQPSSTCSLEPRTSQ
jgi:hypothetical protein